MLEAQGGVDRAGLASAYFNLANAYWSKSDYDEALDLLRKGPASPGHGSR